MARLGIDVGGTSVKIAVLQDNGTVRTGQSPFYSRPTAAQLREAIAAAAGGRVRAEVTGICVPGLLADDRSHVKLSVNVPGLMGLPLADLVAGALGAECGPVRVVNDAHATTTDFAETFGLTGRVMAIALGTGVGMGITDDGKFLTVEGASSGHLGQIDVSLDDDAPIGPDDGRGGLEGYLGVPALKRLYGDRLNEKLATLTRNDAPLRALARAIRVAHAIYRPQHVGLLGGIGVRLRDALPELDALVRDKLTGVARDGWTLRCGQDDFHAARGAARLAAE
jgi:predicted NBD/HSP70 family sugar kinase